MTAESSFSSDNGPTPAVGDAAATCLAAGLSVLPAGKEKRPIGTWKRFQKALPITDEFRGLFTPSTTGLGFVCGAVSGNLEVIDFDLGGAMFGTWKEIVQREARGLLKKLVAERTPSGGAHVFYRCETPVEGNQKLAERMVDGKKTTGIETRGEGGWIVVAPSPGYELLHGSFTALPVLSADERGVLLTAAKVLNEVIPDPVKEPSSHNGKAQRPRHDFADCGDDRRPGDDFSERGNVQ